MGYGSSIDSSGKAINADETRIAPNVGIVDNCEMIQNFTIAEDNGTVSVIFRQENGAEVNHKEWNNPDASDAVIDGVNRRIKHICTKYVTTAEYEEQVEKRKLEGENEDSDKFVMFFTKVAQLLEGKFENKKMRMIFHYNKKNYVQIPNFPNFIEPMDVVPSKLSMSDYVLQRLVRTAAPKADPEMENAGGTDLNDLPF